MPLRSGQIVGTLLLADSRHPRRARSSSSTPITSKWPSRWPRRRPSCSTTACSTSARRSCCVSSASWRSAGRYNSTFAGAGCPTHPGGSWWPTSTGAGGGRRFLRRLPLAPRLSGAGHRRRGGQGGTAACSPCHHPQPLPGLVPDELLRDRAQTAHAGRRTTPSPSSTGRRWSMPCA